VFGFRVCKARWRYVFNSPAIPERKRKGGRGKKKNGKSDRIFAAGCTASSPLPETPLAAALVAVYLDAAWKSTPSA